MKNTKAQATKTIKGKSKLSQYPIGTGKTKAVPLDPRPRKIVRGKLLIGKDEIKADTLRTKREKAFGPRADGTPTLYERGLLPEQTKRKSRSKREAKEPKPLDAGFPANEIAKDAAPEPFAPIDITATNPPRHVPMTFAPFAAPPVKLRERTHKALNFNRHGLVYLLGLC